MILMIRDRMFVIRDGIVVTLMIPERIFVSFLVLLDVMYVFC